MADDDAFVSLVLVLAVAAGLAGMAGAVELGKMIGLGEPWLFGAMVVGFLTGFFGLFFVLIAILIGAEFVLNRKRLPSRTFGRRRWVGKKEVEEIDECLNCGVEGAEGYQVTYGEYLFAFGVAWRTVSEGVHTDCAICVDDPIEAGLRRVNPDRIEHPAVVERREQDDEWEQHLVRYGSGDGRGEA